MIKRDIAVETAPIKFAIELIEECAPDIDLSYLKSIIEDANKTGKVDMFSKYLLMTRSYIQALLDTKQIDQDCVDSFNEEYPISTEDNINNTSRVFNIQLDDLTWKGIDKLSAAMQKDKTCLHAKNLDDALYHMLSVWADAGRKPGSWERGVFSALGLMPAHEQFKVVRDSWEDD